MRIALTGSAGLIGSATARIAADRGHEIIPIDRAHGIDILDAFKLSREVKGADAVIHLAGMLGTSELFDEPAAAVNVNVVGTLSVLNAARDTDAAYVGITMPDSAWPSVYQATKLAATRLAEAYHHRYGFPVTHIRAFNAYGPGQAHGPGHPQKIIPTFAWSSWRGEAMPIWGDGSQTVDLVHVDDIAWRLVAAAEGGPMTGRGQTWDAGSGVETSVLEVARAVGEITGNPEVKHLPMRAGETVGTRLHATQFGPWPPAGWLPFNQDPRFAETVESYRP
jgi:UDP-glucose 4-epimerase